MKSEVAVIAHDLRARSDLRDLFITLCEMPADRRNTAAQAVTKFLKEKPCQPGSADRDGTKM